jgi:hypothetical protein
MGGERRLPSWLPVAPPGSTQWRQCAQRHGPEGGGWACMSASQPAGQPAPPRPIGRARLLLRQAAGPAGGSIGSQQGRPGEGRSVALIQLVTAAAVART